MSKRKKYYISSKMAGLPEFNYPEFFRVEDELKERGYYIVNPAKHSTRMDRIAGERLERKEYLKNDIRNLLLCDGIIMFGDWESSDGALLEFEIANELELEMLGFDTETGEIYGMFD